MDAQRYEAFVTDIMNAQNIEALAVVDRALVARAAERVAGEEEGLAQLKDLLELKAAPFISHMVLQVPQDREVMAAVQAEMARTRNHDFRIAQAWDFAMGPEGRRPLRDMMQQLQEDYDMTFMINDENAPAFVAMKDEIGQADDEFSLHLIRSAMEGIQGYALIEKMNDMIGQIGDDDTEETFQLRRAADAANQPGGLLERLGGIDVLTMTTPQKNAVTTLISFRATQLFGAKMLETTRQIGAENLNRLHNEALDAAGGDVNAANQLLAQNPELRRAVGLPPEAMPLPGIGAGMDDDEEGYEIAEDDDEMPAPAPAARRALPGDVPAPARAPHEVREGNTPVEYYELLAGGDAQAIIARRGDDAEAHMAIWNAIEHSEDFPVDRKIEIGTVLRDRLTAIVNGQRLPAGALIDALNNGPQAIDRGLVRLRPQARSLLTAMDTDPAFVGALAEIERRFPGATMHLREAARTYVMPDRPEQRRRGPGL